MLLNNNNDPKSPVLVLSPEAKAVLYRWKQALTLSHQEVYIRTHQVSRIFVCAPVTQLDMSKGWSQCDVWWGWQETLRSPDYCVCGSFS